MARDASPQTSPPGRDVERKRTDREVPSTQFTLEMSLELGARKEITMTPLRFTLLAVFGVFSAAIAGWKWDAGRQRIDLFPQYDDEKLMAYPNAPAAALQGCAPAHAYPLVGFSTEHPDYDYLVKGCEKPENQFQGFIVHEYPEEGVPWAEDLPTAPAVAFTSSRKHAVWTVHLANDDDEWFGLWHAYGPILEGGDWSVGRQVLSVSSEIGEFCPAALATNGDSVHVVVEATYEYVTPPNPQPYNEYEILYAGSADEGNPSSWTPSVVLSDINGADSIRCPTVTSSGNWVHVFWLQFDPVNNRNLWDLKYSKSDDLGASWSEPALVCEDVAPDTGPSAAALRDFVYVTCNATGASHVTLLNYSSDLGETWSGAFEVAGVPGAQYGPSHLLVDSVKAPDMDRIMLGSVVTYDGTTHTCVRTLFRWTWQGLPRFGAMSTDVFDETPDIVSIAEYQGEGRHPGMFETSLLTSGNGQRVMYRGAVWDHDLEPITAEHYGGPGGGPISLARVAGSTHDQAVCALSQDSTSFVCYRYGLESSSCDFDVVDIGVTP
jgi:hypothetical protein